MQDNERRRNKDRQDLQDTKHEQSNESDLLTRAELEVLDLKYRQRQHGNLKHKMYQCRTKHELGRVDVAHGVLNMVVPVGTDRYAVEDGHESSDGEPDHGASLKDTDSHSDVRDTE